jgi:hypothetical protein
MTLPRFSRRRFVGVVAGAAGSVATASLRFASPVQAAPYSKTGPLTDWTIDDMTAPYPRYAQAIGCSRSRDGLLHSDPLDFL